MTTHGLWRLATLCVLALTAVAQRAVADRALTIVAFGDSITAAVRQPPEARWPELLRRSLEKRFPEVAITIVDAGVGENTSREGLRRIERDVLKYAPDFVLVEFGNDATPDPARHVSFAEFVRNLGEIKARVAARKQGRLVLLTFPPMIDEWHAKYRDPFYQQNGGQDADQERSRDLTRQFADEHKVPLADIAGALRAAMARHGVAECVLRDGVHLTDRANVLVADVVFGVIAPEVARRLSAKATE